MWSKHDVSGLREFGSWQEILARGLREFRGRAWNTVRPRVRPCRSLESGLNMCCPNERSLCTYQMGLRREGPERRNARIQLTSRKRTTSASKKNTSTTIHGPKSQRRASHQARFPWVGLKSLPCSTFIRLTSSLLECNFFICHVVKPFVNPNTVDVC